MFVQQASTYESPQQWLVLDSQSLRIISQLWAGLYRNEEPIRTFSICDMLRHNQIGRGMMSSPQVLIAQKRILFFECVVSRHIISPCEIQLPLAWFKGQMWPHSGRCFFLASPMVPELHGVPIRRASPMSIVSTHDMCIMSSLLVKLSSHLMYKESNTFEMLSLTYPICRYMMIKYHIYN